MKVMTCNVRHCLCEKTGQIDYIFVSKDITVAAADIPPIVASGHRPHTAQLILSQERM